MAGPLKVCNLFGVAGKVCMCARRSTIESPRECAPPLPPSATTAIDMSAHTRPTAHPSPHTDTDTD